MRTKMEEEGNAHKLFRYTYAGMNKIMMTIKKGDRHKSRVMRTSRAPFQRCLLKSLLIYSIERRNHTHTTPTHVNRQIDKECAWGRPRLLHTVSKCYF